QHLCRSPGQRRLARPAEQQPRLLDVGGAQGGAAVIRQLGGERWALADLEILPVRRRGDGQGRVQTGRLTRTQSRTSLRTSRTLRPFSAFAASAERDYREQGRQPLHRASVREPHSVSRYASNAARLRGGHGSSITGLSVTVPSNRHAPKPPAAKSLRVSESLRSQAAPLRRSGCTGYRTARRNYAQRSWMPATVRPRVRPADAGTELADYCSGERCAPRRRSCWTRSTRSEPVGQGDRE